MQDRTSETGRAAVVLLLLAVVAAVAVFMVVADPLGLGGQIDRSGADGVSENRDALDAATQTASKAPPARSGLQGRFGEGELGAIRLRLLEVSDRTPIPGQEVKLAARHGGESTALSGEDGVVTFERIAPGRGYRLVIQVPEHASLNVQGLSVVPGETNDLGDILLGLKVVVRGRVVDTTGRPLPQTAISVFTPPKGLLADGVMASMTSQVTSFPPALEEVETDDDGWFALGTLDAGNYQLEARHAGFATRYESGVVVSEDRPARDLTIVLGDGATLKGKVLDDEGRPVIEARVVAIKDTGRRFFSGGRATVERDYAETDASGTYVLDTLMQGVSYRLGVLADGYSPIYGMNSMEIQNEVQTHDFTLVEGGAIHGRVVRKADGKPVADATVLVGVGRMFGRRRGSGGEDNKVSAKTVVTDEDGEFTISNILPGPVMTGQVKAPGYVPQSASQWTGNSWGDVVAGEVLEVPTIEMAQGATVTGVVADAVGGVAIPGAEVMIVPRGGTGMRMTFMTGAPQSRCNEKGEYVISGVPPGEYGLVATANGYAASDAQAENNAVTVGEDGGTAMLDVVLQRAASITGVVTDSKGEPIAGARVRTRIAPQPRQEGQSGRGGRRGGRRSSRMASFLPGGSGADLTDQDGRYVIENVSSDRRWIVTAEADEFVPTESDPLEVGIGQVEKLDLVLVGGGNLAGRVVDDRGHFVEGARVRVGKLPSDIAGRSRLRSFEADRYLEPTVYYTDEDGKFLALNLPPGRAIVKVEQEGFVTYYKRNAEVRADETTADYVVTLSRGETMEGVVKGTDGKPVKGAMVAVTKDANPSRRGSTESTDGGGEELEIEPRLTDRTDDAGKFRIEHVPPGDYSVVVWFAPGYQAWSRNQDEGAINRNVNASSRSVEFRLTPSASSGGMGMPGRGR